MDVLKSIPNVLGFFIECEKTCSILQGVYCIVGGHSVVHFSELVLLTRALATGKATVILQVFENNEWFCIRTRPRINCGLVSKTH